MRRSRRRHRHYVRRPERSGSTTIIMIPDHYCWQGCKKKVSGSLVQPEQTCISAPAVVDALQGRCRDERPGKEDRGDVVAACCRRLSDRPLIILPSGWTCCHLQLLLLLLTSRRRVQGIKRLELDRTKSLDLDVVNETIMMVMTAGWTVGKEGVAPQQDSVSTESEEIRLRLAVMCWAA